MYHKSCRSLCNSYRVKRVRDNLEKHQEETAGTSPKKLRSSVDPCPDAKNLHCIICEGHEQSEFRKISTDDVDEHLKDWAKTTKNYLLYSRLTACSDTHAMDAYYHVKCYWSLRDKARALQRQSSSDEAILTPFDSMAMAQLIALVEDSHTEVFKLS